MAKEDFAVGLLQGLYGAGVGNPEVNRSNRMAALQEAYFQQNAEKDKQEMVAMMAEQGMMPVNEPPTMQKVRNGIFDFIFPGGGGGGLQSAYPKFTQDPNAQFGYVDPSGNIGTKQTPGSIRISPKEMKEASIKKATQPSYVIPQFDADGNQVGLIPVPRGQKPTTVVRPQSKTGKLGSSSVDATFKLYETARDGLLTGLEGTRTGYFSGKLPAITANQQTAQGAVAAMAPVLKQLFRVAGEGVFTDRDQALLLEMIPTRDTDPKARTAQIQNIDRIVKAKLGMEVGPISDNGGPLTIGSQEEYDALPAGSEYFDPSGAKRRKK